MNTPSNAVPEFSSHSQPVAPAAVSPARVMYWSVRRELWENRSIYIVPLIAAGIFLLAHLISVVFLRRHADTAWRPGSAQAGDAFATHYEIAAALIMGTALIVGIFYSLDALYGERRDRSVLFWKSLPVSDLTTVLSKLTVPFIILPLLSFAITVATQFIMLLLSSALLLGSGVNLSALWTGASFFHVSLVLLYHLLTVHGLWYAPIYGWLLLVSAWAPRAPFLWAFMPPFVICGLEKIAFNTTHCLDLLKYRLSGPNAPEPQGPGMDYMAHLIPQPFFTQPGLRTGMLVAAIFVALAVRLRRYQGPI
jgi:ABC-2 type transport system permease protein